MIRPDRVVVAREVVVVGAGAVGLDDQAAMRPAEVGLVRTERDVHERLVEAGLADEVVDVVLEDGLGRDDVGGDRAEWLRSGARDACAVVIRRG